MPWLYENGIGEERAAYIKGGQIMEAQIVRESHGVRAGAVTYARLVCKLGPSRGIAALESGADVIVSHLPAQISEGRDLRVRIVRQAISESGPEYGRYKYALARYAADDTPLRPSPRLIDDLELTGDDIVHCAPQGEDRLAGAGWYDVIEEAQSGVVAFAGGTLVIAPTPAMTVIDIDGEGPVRALSLKAAEAAALAIVRLDIGGTAVIDFPLLESKSDRTAAAERFDTAMTGPHERTAINGFGLMQIVRRYERPSLLQIVQQDRDMTFLLALLRRAERDTGTGPIILHLTQRMQNILASHAQWTETLARRTGRNVEIDGTPACSADAATLSGPV